MKIRSGFVSNSSSSSFICDVCGHDASGWDLGLHDAEMYQCENGHTFCEDHALDLGDEKEMAKMLAKSAIEIYTENAKKYGDDDGHYAGYIKEEEAFLVELEDEDYEVDTNDLDEKYDLRYDYPSKGCPICQMEVVTSDDMVSYFLKKHGVTSEEVKEEMKNKFLSYDELKEYTK
jgi:hypothetical protein